MIAMYNSLHDYEDGIAVKMTKVENTINIYYDACCLLLVWNDPLYIMPKGSFERIIIFVKPSLLCCHMFPAEIPFFIIPRLHNEHP